MFKAIKNGKIIAVNDENDFPCLVCDAVYEDARHAVSDFVHHDGEFLLKTDMPAPTREEQAEKRAAAYARDVDPITAHIGRLRDEGDPDEDKIAALIAERAQKVADIKTAYPYPQQ